ncbi:MAG: response regulator transcription factor [Vicinamibacterales bacterium]
MHLLLVEDDPTISRFLLRGLREENHVVDLAEDADAAEQLVGAEDYDAILLDLMLPGQTDGFAFCRRLREQRVDTPVLMLTARDGVADRVQGLDLGADDYLTKPFAFDELLARLRALTRRGRTRQMTASLSYGPLAMDLDTHRVTVDGREIHLSATEYRLLEFLIRRAETVVSRTQLADRVWGSNYDPASNLADVYVGYLRRKLAGVGSTGSLIRTIRGLGYMLKVDEGGEA